MSVRAEVEREPVSIAINQLTVRPGWLPIRQVIPLLPYATEVVEQAKPTPLPWRTGIAGFLLLMAVAGLHRRAVGFPPSIPRRPRYDSGIGSWVQRVRLGGSGATGQFAHGSGGI